MTGKSKIMEKYFKRKAPEIDGGNSSRNPYPNDINWEEEIKYDPGIRKQIDAYHPNHREKVRRKYLENRPCQPRTAVFQLQLLERSQEGLIQNGLMSLEVGLNIVSPRTEHTAFFLI
jgi:hypothetical protein